MYINGHDHCLQHISNERGYVLQPTLLAYGISYMPSHKLTRLWCSLMQFLTSGGGSKAWKNIIHYGRHNDSMHFYHDGQGFISVEVTRAKAKIAFYDVFGRSVHGLKLERGRKMKLYNSEG